MDLLLQFNTRVKTIFWYFVRNVEGIVNIYIYRIENRNGKLDVYHIKHIYYQQLFFTNEYTLLFDIQSNLIGSKESRCA